MAKRLIIVESPAKARTIQKFVSSSYTVKASMGHIRDLPKSQLGVDVEDGFTPKYLVIKGKAAIIKELKAAAKKSDEVYLASDPDREGEAIAWHLSQVLKHQNISRIALEEITKSAVLAALKKPSVIDMDRVNAQQARRILDRLVGYKLSPLLWRKVSGGLSAGRVQSVAVRVICEREREIEGFTAEEYWSITAHLNDTAHPGAFHAKLTHVDGEKAALPNEGVTTALVEELTAAAYRVQSIGRREQRRNPSPPFITSTLQQEASRKLGFKVARTMMVAQQLYEGLDIGPAGRVGLITYMRTDSMRIADQAVEEAKQYIINRFGEPYVGPIRKYKARPGAQEAHEAIRPTSMEYSPEQLKEYLNRDQFVLYKLVWDRFLASQMASQILDIVTIDIAAGRCTLRTVGTTVKFPGFAALYVETKEETNGEAEDEEAALPPVEEGDPLALDRLEPKQHFTQPPPRYTEASLIKTLEENGIGRPSTYAPIVETIQKRGYVTYQEKKFRPSPLGMTVTDLLKEHFPTIVSVDFTAGMEEQLDKVEEGSTSWVEILKAFYEPFVKTLDAAQEALPVMKVEPEPTGEMCDKCGQPLVVRRGRFGQFIACSGFPACKNTKPLLKEIGVACRRPGCTGSIVERSSRKGKFFGCSKYPECDFSSWDRPTDKTCANCGGPMGVRVTRNDKWFLHCLNKECAGSKMMTPARQDGTPLPEGAADENPSGEPGAAEPAAGV